MSFTGLRTIYDVDGNDVTSTVQAYLRGNPKSVYMSNLYLFYSIDFWHYNPYADYVYWCYTDADYPIFINKIFQGPAGVMQLGYWASGAVVPVGATFFPETIDRSAMTYEVGFKSNDVEIAWYTNDAVDYAPPGPGGGPLYGAVNPPNLTLKQAFLLGAFDEVPFWIYRAIFTDNPLVGGTLLGVTLMYRGFVRGAEAATDHLKIKLSSLMDLFKIQIPTQVVQPDSRAVAYLPAGGAVYDISGLNNVVVINETAVFFTGTSGIPRDGLKDNYVIFQPFTWLANWAPKNGQPPPPMWRIAGNDATVGGNTTVYFYDPPVIPNGGHFSQNFAPGTLTYLGGPGFPLVPPPTFGT